MLIVCSLQRDNNGSINIHCELNPNKIVIGRESEHSHAIVFKIGVWH